MPILGQQGIAADGAAEPPSGSVLGRSEQGAFPASCFFIRRATPAYLHEFCAPVAARLNANLEQDVDFCPGSSKSQTPIWQACSGVRPNVGYGERIPASASSRVVSDDHIPFSQKLMRWFSHLFS